MRHFTENNFHVRIKFLLLVTILNLYYYDYMESVGTSGFSKFHSIIIEF